MDLLNMLMGSMSSESSVGALTSLTGGSNDQIMKLIKLALPILLKALTSNASSADGAASLLGALTQHTSQKSMADQITEADEEDGLKIVNHILGDKQTDAVTSLAAETEMTTDQVTKGLAGLAPALMSGLSAATTSAAKVDLSDGIDLSDLMGLFGGAAGQGAGSGLLGAIGGLLGGGSAEPAGAAGGLFGAIGSLFGGSEKEEPAQAAGFDSNALLGTLASLMKTRQ